MLPILLIHGYSSEGKDGKVADIYGSLPRDLTAAFGDDAVVEFDLSRWIALEDGIALDDVSFALNRALNSSACRSLLSDGLHVVIHSTGALVIRNWPRLYSPKPSPLINLARITPKEEAYRLAANKLGKLRQQRLSDEDLEQHWYDYELDGLAERQRLIPFGVMYETAHFGDSIGILTGSRNRRALIPLLKRMLSAPYDEARYAGMVKRLTKLTE